jgi:hypothetical protein
LNQSHLSLTRIFVTFLALSAPLATLTGCMMRGFPDTSVPTVETGSVVTPPLQGSVYGGHAPLVGAKVYVLSPNLASLYGQSISLMDGDSQNNTLSPSGTGNGVVSSGGTNTYHYVTTDSTGAYNLTGDYACTVDQAVYLVAVGGSPTFPSGSNVFNVSQVVVSGLSGSGAAETATYTFTTTTTENIYIGEQVTLANLTSSASGSSAADIPFVDQTTNVVVGSVAAGSNLTTTQFSIVGPDNAGGIASGTYPLSSGTATVLPTANPAAVNMTALGLCPSSGSFAGTISYIYTNEVSTAAMAVATAAFASGPFNVGVATGGTVDAHYASYDKNGLKQALNNANLLYDFTGGNITTSYAGEGHIARTVTPSGNGIVPQALMDTWGNVLAACVDSNNTGTGTSASPQCATLFATATSTGIACTVGTGNAIACPSGTTAPTEIATAAYNIAHFPAGTATTVGTNPAFVNTLYTLPAGNVPFTPNLVSTGAGQPNDFSVAIGFFAPTSAGSTTTNSISAPQVITINGGNYVGNESNYTSDAAGELQESVWIANFNGPIVKLFANGGAPDYTTNAALKNYSFNGQAVDARSVVIDGAENVWATYQFGLGAEEFSVTGTPLLGFTTSSTNPNYIGGNNTGTLLDGAIDGAGTSYNLYLSGYTEGIVDKVAVVNGTTSTATNVQGAGGTGNAAFSTATAKTSSGTAACTINVVTFAFAPSGTLFLNSDSSTADPYGYNSNGFTCTINTSTGVQVASAGFGSGFEFQNYGQGPATIAVDKNGASWIGGGQPAAGTPQAGSSNGVYKVVLSGTGNNIATKTAYTGGGMSAPCGVAVDGNNNIWIGNAGTYGVAEVSDAGVALSPVANIGTYANAYGGFNPQAHATWSLNGNTYMTPQTTDSNCASPAIDRAGDIWMAYQGNSYYPGLVFEILGIAAPVVSPRAYATFGNSTTGFLGTRPY